MVFVTQPYTRGFPFRSVFVWFTCMVGLCRSPRQKLTDFCAEAPALVSVPLIYPTLTACASKLKNNHVLHRPLPPLSTISHG